jgi:hypothetical protein
MPFFLIPTTLGVCFCLIWVFIGGMIFRDGQLAAQRERDADVTILPMPLHRRVSRPKSGRRAQPMARFAS